MDRDILVWGAGAIGGTVGAYLKRSGRDVTFVDIDAPHVAAIRDPARGLVITGPIDTFRVVAPSAMPAEVEGRWKRIFLAVKAHHTREACQALAPHLAPDGYVLSLQNGLCERIIAGVVGPERCVGAFVNFGADWLGPGEIIYANRGAVVLGEIDGKMTPRLKALRKLMLDFDRDAVETDNIWGYLWAKLGYGALLFGTALTNDSIADALALPQYFGLWHALGSEIMAVAAAEKVKPLGFNGFDPAAFTPGADRAQTQRSIDEMVAHNRKSAKSHSGIWRDLAVRKRKTEVDAQIAIISDIAEKHGLKTPLTRRIVTLIHDIEDGRLPLDRSNLDRLAEAMPKQ